MLNESLNKNYQNGVPAYSLKVGDMFSTDHGFGLITKITSRKYYYRVISGKESEKGYGDFGMHREDFWRMADDAQTFNNLTLYYSPDMKYRRKRKLEVQD